MFQFFIAGKNCTATGDFKFSQHNNVILYLTEKKQELTFFHFWPRQSPYIKDSIFILSSKVKGGGSKIKS